MTVNDNNVVKSIVLVDDDADFLHFLQRRLFEQRGEFASGSAVEVHKFTDPVEALVNLPAEGICVAVLDFNMPGGTGLDWLPKFLKAGLGPVLLLTSQNDAKTAAEAFRAGAADYIAKSDVTADVDRLVRGIREAVHRYRLESRNQSLTRELKILNLELETKNKRLQELTQTAEQFVDDVAHDFRTPLTVVQQYSSIISEGLSGPVSEQQIEHLQVINEAAQDMAEMVDDFLDTSKLRARALSVNRQHHTADELFKSIEPMLNVRTGPKRIGVSRRVEDDLPPFFADLSKAGRVLSNLVVNAIKVTPDGREIELSASRTESGDVRISVTDPGPGIKPEDLKVIFDRFKQLNEPCLEAAKGFGLGLSIVKYLTWLNFGKLDVQSEPGKGATFSFELPAFDLHRIVERFVENIQQFEETRNLWMLEVRVREGALDASKLRRLITSCSFAMDLVWEDSEEQVVRTVGVSGNTEVWSRRLRAAAERFDTAIGQKNPTRLDIEVKGPWRRDSQASKLVETLMESLSRRTANV